jgi:hypothetical protein
MGFQLAMKLDAVEGQWHAFIRDNAKSKRNAELVVMHESAFDTYASELVGTIGVDGGAAGVFDKAYKHDRDLPAVGRGRCEDGPSVHSGMLQRIHWRMASRSSLGSSKPASAGGIEQWSRSLWILSLQSTRSWYAVSGQGPVGSSAWQTTQRDWKIGTSEAYVGGGFGQLAGACTLHVCTPVAVFPFPDDDDASSEQATTIIAATPIPSGVRSTPRKSIGRRDGNVTLKARRHRRHGDRWSARRRKERERNSDAERHGRERQVDRSRPSAPTRLCSVAASAALS